MFSDVEYTYLDPGTRHDNGVVTQKVFRRFSTPIIISDRFLAQESEMKIFKKEGLLVLAAHSTNFMRNKCPYEIKQNAEELVTSITGWFIEQKIGSLKCNVSYVWKGTLGGMVPAVLTERLFKSEFQRVRIDHQKEFPPPILNDV